MIARSAVAVAPILCRSNSSVVHPLAFMTASSNRMIPTAVRARISARERPWLQASALGAQLFELGRVGRALWLAPRVEPFDVELIIHHGSVILAFGCAQCDVGHEIERSPA
jgi:hypothetical protein